MEAQEPKAVVAGDVEMNAGQVDAQTAKAVVAFDVQMNAGQLLAIITRAGKGLDKKASNPVHRVVWLKSVDGIVEAMGQGVEVSIGTKEKVGSGASKPGEAAVEHFPLVQVLRKMPSAGQVRLKKECEKAEVTGGKNIYEIKTMPLAKYEKPDLSLEGELAKLGEPAKASWCSLEIGSGEMDDALRCVKHAVQWAQSKESMNGLVVNVKDGKCWLVAPGQDTMAIAEVLGVKATGANGRWVLKKRMVDELAAMVVGFTGPLKVELGHGVINVTAGNTVMRSVLFRAYMTHEEHSERSFEEREWFEKKMTQEIDVRVGRKDVLECLKRICRSPDEVVHVSIERDELGLRSGSDGKYEEWLRTSGLQKNSEGEWEAGIDEKVLGSALKNCVNVGKGYGMDIRFKHSEDKTVQLLEIRHEGMDGYTEWLRLMNEDDEGPK